MGNLITIPLQTSSFNPVADSHIFINNDGGVPDTSYNHKIIWCPYNSIIKGIRLVAMSSSAEAVASAWPIYISAFGKTHNVSDPIYVPMSYIYWNDFLIKLNVPPTNDPTLLNSLSLMLINPHDVSVLKNIILFGELYIEIL